MLRLRQRGARFLPAPVDSGHEIRALFRDPDAQRAADELAATGATARPRRPFDTEPLTSQETRVALLVAQGLSNRDAAAKLFLSPKTVEHHLASVFRKRGFRSRTELARAWATGPPQP